MGVMANGAPTKDFFVGMLTRDIELSDAILDLLDNCLDGVVRQKGTLDKSVSSDYYTDFYANISISKDSFVIEDNCGGIPRDVAEQYAFRMGRSSEKDDDNLPTVGIYGIGMKRAIFKIGRSAEVITRNDGLLYKVTIPLTWADSDDIWDFPLEEFKDDELLLNGGTKIIISNINSEIAGTWDNGDKINQFVEHMIKAIQQSYSFIVQKGFSIKINDKVITPLPVSLLMEKKGSGDSIKPFVYKATFEDVEVNLAVGFYAPPPSQEEIDDANNLKRSSSDAGWTVVCNDRVVLYNDKSHLTGWGEAGVPQYHTQFTGIRGVVFFESKNPRALPMTTTKRGVDTSSKIYSAVKDKMRQGLKMFTDYTNRWKGKNEEEREHSTKAKNIQINEIINNASKTEGEDNQTLLPLRRSQEGYIFKPKLPKPHYDKPYKIIRFSRADEEIDDIKEFFYNDRDNPASPSKIGEKCFDTILKYAKKAKE